MRSVLPLAPVVLALLLPGPARSQATADRQPIRMMVYLPADALLTVDGARTVSTGAVRYFESPPVARGRQYQYVLQYTFRKDGRDVTRKQVAQVEPGRDNRVDLREDADAGPAATKVPDVIYVPTPQEIVDRMLEMAKVKKGDLVYDLGCGDGRIVVTAAKKYGCKAVGFDVDPERIRESKANVRRNKVGDLVTIEQKDIFTLDLSKANVVTLYLLPELNARLIPQLQKLKAGSRIVSHNYDMDGMKPDKRVEVTAKDGSQHVIFLWTTPLKKEK